MNEKDFEVFAEYIKNLPKQFGKGKRRNMAEMVAKVAIKHNPNFDKERFFTACGL